MKAWIYAYICIFIIKPNIQSLGEIINCESALKTFKHSLFEYRWFMDF